MDEDGGWTSDEDSVSEQNEDVEIFRGDLRGIYDSIDKIRKGIVNLQLPAFFRDILSTIGAENKAVYDKVEAMVRAKSAEMDQIEYSRQLQNIEIYSQNLANLVVKGNETIYCVENYESRSHRSRERTLVSVHFYLRSNLRIPRTGSYGKVFHSHHIYKLVVAFDAEIGQFRVFKQAVH